MTYTAYAWQRVQRNIALPQKMIRIKGQMVSQVCVEGRVAINYVEVRLQLSLVSQQAGYSWEHVSISVVERSVQWIVWGISLCEWEWEQCGLLCSYLGRMFREPLSWYWWIWAFNNSGKFHIALRQSRWQQVIRVILDRTLRKSSFLGMWRSS